MSGVFEAARRLVGDRRPGALVTVVGPGSGPKAVVDGEGIVVAGALPEDLPGGETAAIVAMIRREESGTIDAGGRRLFVEALVPAPRLLLFGAGPVAEALCRLASAAGFVVEVGDPRPAFANAERFPDAAVVRCGWPADLLKKTLLDDRTYVVSLLHEHRFEADLLPPVLRSPARYIGALGSSRTHAARLDRLRAEGFGDEELARIHGPVGLDIGAVTPEEIAVAIVAEIISVRRVNNRESRTKTRDSRPS